MCTRWDYTVVPSLPKMPQMSTVGLPAVDDISLNGPEATSEMYRAFVYDPVAISNHPPSEGGKNKSGERKRVNWGGSSMSTEGVSVSAMVKVKAYALTIRKRKTWPDTLHTRKEHRSQCLEPGEHIVWLV
jgi:hypothetical protein